MDTLDMCYYYSCPSLHMNLQVAILVVHKIVATTFQRKMKELIIMNHQMNEFLKKEEKKIVQYWSFIFDWLNHETSERRKFVYWYMYLGNMHFHRFPQDAWKIVKVDKRRMI